MTGTTRRTVTRDGNIVAAPCWVPGQLALYYTSYKLGSPNIFYQNLTSGARHNFAHYPGMNSSAAVSPDGRRVAMILSKSGSPDVYVGDAGRQRFEAIDRDARGRIVPVLVAEWAVDLLRDENG